jgi:hypothetical protein
MSRGFNIRRLISTRARSKEPERTEAEEWAKLQSEEEWAKLQSETEEWAKLQSAGLPGIRIDSRPTTPRPQSSRQTPIVIGTPPSIHGSPGPLRPRYHDTARSSISSRGSGDKPAAFSSPSLDVSGFRRPSLCSTPPKSSRSESPFHSASDYDHDHSLSLPRDNVRLPITPASSRPGTAHSSGSRADRSRASSVSTVDKDRDASPQGGNEAVTPGNIPYSIKQLIRETDQAFNALDGALVTIDAPRTPRTGSGELPNLPPIDTQVQHPPVHNPQTQHAHAHAHAQQPPSKKFQYRVYPPPTVTPSFPPLPPQVVAAAAAKRTQTTAAVKAKRRNSRSTTPPMKPSKPQRRSMSGKPPVKKDSKWTENVSDLLSGKLFGKIEVDEMLTPAQIEAYKLQRECRQQQQEQQKQEQKQQKEQQQQQAAMADATADFKVADKPMHEAPVFDSDTLDTPIEPFHMDDLPLRIGSSGVRLTASTPIEEKQNHNVLMDAIDRHGDELPQASAGNTTSTQEGPATTETSDHGASMSIHNHYLAGKHPELPTISESGAGEDEMLLAPPADTRDTDSIFDSEYVFFESTPFTMTIQGFQHGPIRLAKADICPEPPMLGPDDGLDWTAFQMAIIGGAGDYFTDSDYTIRQREAEEVEAICDWWQQWGFDNPGGLVTSASEEPSSPSTISGESTLDGDRLYQEIGADNPYSTHHDWRHLRRTQTPSEAPEAVVSTRHSGALGLSDCNLRLSVHSDKMYNSSSIKKWNADGHVERILDRGRVGSLGSLPPSPMLDLQVITSDNGDVDYVPMGYNLSHDLGDFLSWEAENVYSDNAIYDGGMI